MCCDATVYIRLVVGILVSLERPHMLHWDGVETAAACELPADPSAGKAARADAEACKRTQRQRSWVGSSGRLRACQLPSPYTTIRACVCAEALPWAFTSPRGNSCHAARPPRKMIHAPLAGRASRCYCQQAGKDGSRAAEQCNPPPAPLSGERGRVRSKSTVAVAATTL